VAPSITTQPASQAVLVGGSASFSVVAAGTAPFSYQWSLDGQPVGASLPSFSPDASVFTAVGSHSIQVVVSNALGNVTSSPATLTVAAAAVPPSITTQPADQTVLVGGSATFSVVAAGTAPLTYQWSMDGQIQGSTLATFTPVASVLAVPGSHRVQVVVGNAAGSATSNQATLTVNPAPVAPSITTQPGNLSVLVGSSATFTVDATGTAPLTYQWSLDDQLQGSTQASFTPDASVFAAPGSHRIQVVVANGVGSATSNQAILTVTAAPLPPAITTQPVDQTVQAGASATFSVVATGTAPLTYQWSMDTLITASTSASFTPDASVFATPGIHAIQVVVNNAVGSATSNLALLTVTPPPVPPGHLTYATNPATYTRGTRIPANTPSSTGDAVTLYAVAQGRPLPAGLSLDPATGAITGTPTAITATATYVITASNGGGSTRVNLVLTVLDAPPGGLSYASNPASYNVGSAIAGNLPTLAQGSNVTYSAPLGLPAGLSIDPATGALTGTPSGPAAAGASTWPIVAGNVQGSTSCSLQLTVLGPLSLIDYGSSSLTFEKGIPKGYTPTVHGQALSNWAVSSGTLPTGLSLDQTGQISGSFSGTPGSVQVGIIASNALGTSQALVTLVTTQAQPAFYYGDGHTPFQFRVGEAIPTLTPTSNRASGVTYAWSGAGPAGLTLDSGTGALSGTPTQALAQQAFTVQGTDASGASGTAQVTLSVIYPDAPNIRYQPSSVVVAPGQAVTLTPINTGGAATYSLSQGQTLPTGLSLDSGTGAITGSPSACPTTTYSITASNGSGTSTTSLTLAVADAAPAFTYGSNGLQLTTATTWTINPSVTGGPATYSITPALPAGLALDPNTGAITATASGLTASSDTTLYTITALATDGSNRTASATLPIQVILSATVGGSTSVTPGVSDQTFTLTTGTPVALSPSGTRLMVDLSGQPIDPALPRAGTGVSYAMSSSLPAGLHLEPSTGVIWGTPTAVSSLTTYTVTCNSINTYLLGSTTYHVNLTVNAPAVPPPAPPTSLSYSPNAATFIKGIAGPVLRPSYQGGGGTFTIAPALPAGLSLDANTGVITGTATGSATTGTFTVTLANAAPGSVNASLTLTVVDFRQPVISYGSTPLSFPAGTRSSYTPVALGGYASNFQLAAGSSLPAGLSLNNADGTLYGQPTASGSPRPVTLIADVNPSQGSSNVLGSTSVQVSFSIPDEPPTVNYFSTTLRFLQNRRGSFMPAPNPGSALTWSMNPNTSGYTPPVPGGLSIDPDTGEISGTLTDIVSGALLTVTATNQSNQSSSTDLTIDVVATDLHFNYSSSSLTLPVATNPAYSTQSLTPGGDIPPGTVWSISPQPLPDGMAFDTTTGTISGVLAQPMATPAQFRVLAVTPDGQSQSADLSIQGMLAPSVSYGDGTLAFWTGGSSTYTPTLHGGPVTTWSMTSRSNLGIPAGLAFDAATGTLSGQPTTTAVDPQGYHIFARNAAGGCLRTVFITVASAAPALRYPTGPLVFNPVGPRTYRPLSALDSVPGGWSITPALPPGVSLDMATGALSGELPAGSTLNNPYRILAGGGMAEITLQAATALGTVGYASDPLVFSQGIPGSYTPTYIPAGYVDGVASWSLTGSLPGGLSFDPRDGTIRGTPTDLTQAGSDLSFTLTATPPAGTGAPVSSTVTLRVTPVTLGSFSYQTAAVCHAGQFLSVSPIAGLVATPGCQFTLDATSAPLPDGLSLDPWTGIISGRPTAVSPATLYTVNATNAINDIQLPAFPGLTLPGPSTIQASVTIRVLNAAPNLLYPVDAEDGKLHVPPTLNTTTAFMPVNLGGAATGFSLQGLLPPLPGSVAVDPGTGAVLFSRDGEDPSQNGPYQATFFVNATNGSLSQRAQVDLFIERLAPYHLSAPNLTLYTGQAMTPTTLAFRSGGDASGIAWTSNLPAGLGIAPDAPILSGTPGSQIPARSVFTVTAADANAGTTSSWPITLRVVDPIPVSLSYTQAPAFYTQGQTVSNAPLISPGSNVTWAFALAQGSPDLPGGLSLDPVTGLLSGTPTADGDATCIIQASNSTGYAITFPLRIRVGLGNTPTLSYTPAGSPAGTITASQVDPQSPAAAASTTHAAGAQFLALPALPDGLTLDGHGNVWFTRPPALGTYAFTVLMTTATGSAASHVQFTVQ
jgi:hypothetical protein